MKYTFKPSHIVPATLFVVAVLYGGSKPPMPTNPPPDDVSSPTNAPMCCALGVGNSTAVDRASSVVLDSRVGKRSPDRLSEKSSVGLNSTAVDRADFCTSGQETASPLLAVSNWTARGAYCDWQRIEFRDGFQFPVGTNFIDGVTLFAYGELKSNLHCSPSPSTFTYSLPSRVSLEPGVSSVTHGLTPSNSYLFAWHNCCVERCATNRVDASIELFRSGAVATTITPLSTPTPPTYTYQPAVPPAGFIGHGQDADWIRATFPDEADDILSMGYENWLSEWVGENEMNGRYQMAVTIDQPPTTNDQAPIYLVCGPYRVNATASGTYHFPLEVLTTYETRTYPTAVPLSFAYDDGYTGEGQSYHVLDGQNPPHGSMPLLMMLAEPMHIPYDYWKTLCPDIVVTPDHLPFETASGSHLRFWCNVRDLTIAAIKGAAWLTWYEISHSEVALDRVDQIGWYYAYAHERDWLLSGDFVVDPPSSTNEPNEVVTNRTDAWIFSGETIHTEIVPTNRLVTHVTAVSGTNPTASLSIRLAEGQSAYVAVYMASTEPDGTPPYDDTVSWSVTSNGGGSLSGSTSVFAQSEGLAGQLNFEHYVYGMLYDPVVLGCSRFTAPADDSLRLQITVSASDAVDDLRETCVQVAVYPIDENGNVVGLPNWVGE